jgi:hypothetical protein
MNRREEGGEAEGRGKAGVERRGGSGMERKTDGEGEKEGSRRVVEGEEREEKGWTEDGSAGPPGRRSGITKKAEMKRGRRERGGEDVPLIHRMGGRGRPHRRPECRRRQREEGGERSGEGDHRGPRRHRRPEIGWEEGR